MSEQMDSKSRFAEEWETAERLIAATCRKRGLRDADAEDFASLVRVKLLEDDCAILRNFRGDSKLSTYLTVIIQRAFVDFCIQQSGKWHASAVAKRLGPAAVTLERLTAWNDYPPAIAISRVLTEYPELTRGEVEAMLAQLPSRQRRRLPVSIETVASSLRDEEEADILVITSERRALSERAAVVIRSFLRAIDESDRLMLQLTFESNMQLSKVARILGTEQKPLYRRRDQLLRDLREAMTQADIRAEDAVDLIGHMSEETDFGLRKQQLVPSEPYAVAAIDEEVPR